MSLEQTMREVMRDDAYLPSPTIDSTVVELTETETNEVIGLLSERPIHTICMMGSPINTLCSRRDKFTIGLRQAVLNRKLDGDRHETYAEAGKKFGARRIFVFCSKA